MAEWKKFRRYLSKKECDENNEPQLQGQQSIENSARLNIWKEYQAYQLMKVNNAKKMVEFWQRQANFYQQIEEECWQMVRKHYRKDSMTDISNSNELGDRAQRYRSYAEEEGAHAQRYRSHAETERSHAGGAQQQVRPAELRLEWIAQQIQSILSEQSVSSVKTPTSDQLQAQVKSQRATSKSDQSAPRNLRYKRADKSTVRTYRGLSNKNKVNSVLSTVHSSKVSRVCKATSSRHWPQSRIFAERIDRQEQGPYAAISSISSASVLPRRSSRLARYKQNSSALQSELTVNANITEKSSFIKTGPRRSERISQQEKRISGSMLNSVMGPRTNSFKNMTRPKPKRHVTRNELGVELATSSGVSKRQFKKRLQTGVKKVRL